MAVAPSGCCLPDFVYLDFFVVKVRQEKRVINKSIFLALGINTEGHKELTGMWIAESEGVKFWLSVLTELQQRGVENIRLLVWMSKGLS